MLIGYLGSVTNMSENYQNLSTINLWLSLLSLVLLVFGLTCLYKINKHGDDKNFIERIICLSFPIGIRIAVFFIPVVSTAFIIGTYQASLSAYTKLGVGYGVIFMLYYYYALYHGIKIAAGKKGSGSKRK